ncbi:MAG: BolA family transcriptional regulator [Alphaproteobacteria bacterium]|nr:MAG: BolA family transcriptional regulator [Alphaproteobacteria bacterium]TAF13346.1 MAG: BolA family transcriptional regulator [Alphaproteobacteria bacterium]TAF38504.1 MAG: BolA family transcriptional regulator [Alphaproteobacteria bacterium]TAF75470.1 MAG: BolA family transcriptional regulator [Alphaproteobacteria bacterium]
MPLPAEEMTKRIKHAIPDAQIELVDLAGDNDHWQVTVTSSLFNNISRVKQHKMVYDAFGADMGTTLHALSVHTKVA